MQYMLQFHYPKEHRDAALRYLLDHGTMQYDGKVRVTQAWVATRDRIAYVLLEAANQEEVVKATRALTSLGKLEFHDVTSFDEL